MTDSLRDSFPLDAKRTCSRCQAVTAMIGLSSGSVRQPGDIVICLICLAPHVWLREGVRAVTRPDIMLMDKDEWKALQNTIAILRDPIFLSDPGNISTSEKVTE